MLASSHHFILLSLMTLLITGAPFNEGEEGTKIVESTTPSTVVAAAEDGLEDYDYYEYYDVPTDEDSASPAHPPVPDHLPRFIIALPDSNLLCFSIEGFELFTYNLLSTPYLQVNSFLNITQTPTGEWVRGSTDLGFAMKIKDSRVKSGQRVFKMKVDGGAKKADIAGFGEVDMKGGSVYFSVDSEGHTNIESEEAEHEQFTVSMESPKVTVWGVSRDKVTYNVYIEEGAGLLDIPSHGILGQFLRRDVGINVKSGQLNLGTDQDPIPVSPAPVWDSVQDKGYQDKQCWYPIDQDNLNILEGHPYDYVTEHLLSHKYQFSQFDPKTPL